MSLVTGLLTLLGALGFFLALDARGRMDRMERTLRALQAELRALRAFPPAPPQAAPAEARTEPAETPQPAPAFPAEPLQERAPQGAAAPQTAEQPHFAPAPRPAASLEEAIGTRWVVYVGGIALALGGLLLVRFAIEQGLFGPAARVLLGLGFAAALTGAGEFLRRREKSADEATPTPAVLTAAGATAGFGAIYAAYALYGFIGPGFAFVALGAAGLATMFAAVWHGPAIAGFGLVGALAAPLLIATPDPTPWPLLIYIAIVAASAYGLARLRQWAWLAISCAIGAAIWGLALAVGRQPDFPQAAELHFVVQMALACFAFALDRAALTPSPRWRLALAHAGPLGLAFVASLALSYCANRGDFDNFWLFGALGVVGLLAASGAARPWLAPGLLAGAGALAFWLLALWPTDTPSFDFADAPPVLPVRFQLFAAICAATVAGLAGHSLWRRVEIPKFAALVLAATAALTPLSILCIIYLRLTWAAISLPLGLVALALALAFLAFARAFRQRDAEGSNDRLALGVMASATLAALALGLTFTLDRGMLTVALSLSALGAAFVESRLGVPALRRAVAAMGFVIAARLAWDPRIVDAELGTTLIFNWLLFGYGVPALSFGLAARLLARNGGEDRATQIAEALAIVFSALLVFFQIRHALHGGDLFVEDASLVENGLYAVSAMGFSLVLSRLDLGRRSPVLYFFSLGFGVASALIACLSLALWSNPFFSQRPIIGGRWLNSLLLGYALPAVAAAGLAKLCLTTRPLWFLRMARLMALLLIFLYATLETRRLFQGMWIGWNQATSATEQYAYSAVWLALGVALLAYGLLRHSLEARVASAAVIVLAVLKVFFFDLAHLVGAQRAFSFIGLGAVLIGIGLVYQKLVFRPRKTPES
ncbi:DUF2339 domain-containing protein [Rhodoblastus sp.]|jgi:uncharacterized membrane protein|uniref:DUF2339 domain-containing protein n=1 Tax=Rhodoblastus sp. TaxID=1962975 RepID=UPI0025FE41E7|nr:DUF2339 domain-containing protein [Rhodoblastus sp.]